jgi:F0F1-type ATP synthase alpha subunit
MIVHYPYKVLEKVLKISDGIARITHYGKITSGQVVCIIPVIPEGKSRAIVFGIVFNLLHDYADIMILNDESSVQSGDLVEISYKDNLSIDIGELSLGSVIDPLGNILIDNKIWEEKNITKLTPKYYYPAMGT